MKSNSSTSATPDKHAQRYDKQLKARQDNARRYVATKHAASTLLAGTVFTLKSTGAAYATKLVMLSKVYATCTATQRDEWIDPLDINFDAIK